MYTVISVRVLTQNTFMRHPCTEEWKNTTVQKLPFTVNACGALIACPGFNFMCAYVCGSAIANSYNKPLTLNCNGL